MRRWGAAIAGVLLLSMIAAVVPGAVPASGPDPDITPVPSVPADSPSLPFDNPNWKPGYQWKYTLKMKIEQGGQPITMTGNMTTDAASYSNVSFGNKTYQSLLVTQTGNGRASGNIGGFPFNGPWTIAGKMHVARNTTDELQFEETIKLQNDNPPTTITIYQISNYTPQFMNLKWPMDVATAWTHSGQEVRYNWTLLESPLGKQWLAAPNGTTANFSQNFKATGPVYKVVPAGTFLSLKVGNGTEKRSLPDDAPDRAPLLSSIRASLPSSDQPVPGEADQYYSDAAGNSVQFELKNNGTTTGWINLTSTNYPPPPAKYGSQGGHVRDKAGNGLKDAKVTATPASGPAATGYTDDMGMYVFTNLVPGQYTVKGNLSGYVDAQKPSTVAIGANPDVDLVLLSPTGMLTVATQDELGGALGNTSLRIVGPGVDLTNKTDAAGAFSIEIGIGSYNVTGSKTGYKPVTKTGVQVLLQQATSVTLQLEKIRGSIAGKVTDLKSGFAVVGAKVTVSKAGTTVAEKTTDANGSFKFDLLDPGTYMVTAAAVGYLTQNDNVSVVGGQERAKNFILQKVPPPPDNNPSGSAWMIYAAIGGVVAAVALVALLMMRAKKKKQALEAAKPPRTPGPQEPQW